MRRRETRELPCPLDDVERQERARLLAETVERRRLLAERRREALAELRRLDKTEREAQEQLAAAVRDGVELRSVECEVVEELGIVRVLRLDTGEVVESHARKQLRLAT